MKRKSKFTLSDCKNDYKATIIKVVWYCQSVSTQIEFLKYTEIDSYRHGYLMLDKIVKEIILRIAFSVNEAGQTEYL